LNACGERKFEGCDLGFVDVEVVRKMGFKVVQCDELVFCFGGEEEGCWVEAAGMYC